MAREAVADCACSYIIAVNASIVSDSGGTCVCNEPAGASLIPCEKDTEYLLCVADVKKDLVTATAAISALGTFFMGLFANLYVRVEGNRDRVAPWRGPYPLTPFAGRWELRPAWA